MEIHFREIDTAMKCIGGYRAKRVEKSKEPALRKSPEPLSISI
jgi:hypothetical protein